MAWPGFSYTIISRVAVVYMVTITFNNMFDTHVDKELNASNSTIDQIQKLKTAMEEMTSTVNDIKMSLKSNNNLKLQKLTDFEMKKSQYLQSIKNELETETRAVKNHGGQDMSYKDFKKLLRNEIKEEVEEQIQIENQKVAENLNQILKEQNSKIEKLQKLLSEKEGPVEKLFSRLSEMMEILDHSLLKLNTNSYEKYGIDKQNHERMKYVANITLIIVLFETICFSCCIMLCIKSFCCNKYQLKSALPRKCRIKKVEKQKRTYGSV